MKPFTSISLLGLALAALPSHAFAQTAPDPAPTPAPTPGSFRLPPSSTPTPTDVQGPVDPDAPILTRPRAPTPTPTARPTATATPTPTPAPTRAMPPPPRNGTLPPRFTPAAAPTAKESAAAAASAAQIFPGTSSPATESPAPVVAAPTVAPVTPTQEGASEDGGGWLYALGALLLALAAGAGYFWFRRRQADDVAAVPIEPPRVGPAPSPGSAPAIAKGAPAVTGSNEPLLIEARAVKLSRSMMFATLSYELTVTNRSGMPLDDVRFGGDLVTAHARVPAEQQLADPAVPLAPMQAIARLDPGASAQLTGDLRLPVKDIRPIPHGRAVVYVPLLRVRAEAAGMDPVARTFVVGLLSTGLGEKLQPFRLDEIPQTYAAVGQRALD